MTSTTYSSGTVVASSWLNDVNDWTYNGVIKALRLRGDFSNATLANRTNIQDKTTNNATTVGVIPNGTATSAGVVFHNRNDPDNAQFAAISMLSTEMKVQTSYLGTPLSGTYLPMTFYTGGSERMRIDTSGNVGVGSSTLTQAKMVVKQEAQNYTLDLLGKTGTNVASLRFIDAAYSSDNASIQSLSGGGMILATGGNEKVRIDNSGNMTVSVATGGLGYGTGAGGTVTQATSKSTAVTLNKPTGQITMNNAALAANSSVGFTLNNSLLGAADILLVSLVSTGLANVANYRVRASSASGVSIVILENVSAGSLSEAVVVNFAIIKGATA
jgi:hypothetical protein